MKNWGISQNLRSIYDLFQLAPLVTTSKIQLSNEASILLKEASLDGNGIVLHLSVIGGTIIQTNGRNLVGSDNPREIAKWKSALQELTNKKLLQVRNKNGGGNDSYEITSLGYEIADKLKIIESQKEIST